MFQGESRIFSSLLLYLFLGLLFYAMSVSVVSGRWLVVAALIVVPLGLFLLLQYQQEVMIAWLAGSTTVFIYPNNMLANLPGVTLDRLLFLAFLGLLVFRFAVDKTPGSGTIGARTVGARIAGARIAGPGLIGVEKAILAMLAIALVSLVLHLPGKPSGEQIEDVLLWFRGLFMPMMTLVLVRRFAWDDRYINLLFSAMIAAGLYLAVCGYLQFFAGADFFRPRYLENMIHPRRVTGTFPNAIEYGAFVGIILIIAVYQFRQARSNSLKAFLLLVMFALGGVIVLAQGRAVWLGLMLAFAVIVVADRQARRMILSLVGVMTVGLIVFLLFSADTMVADMLSERLNEESPILNRIVSQMTAVNMIADRPLLGFGFGRFTFSSNAREYLATIGTVSPQYVSGVGIPHNELLHIGVLTGLVGLAAYIAVFAGIVSLLLPGRRKAARDDFVDGFRPYLVGMLLLILLNAQFADIMWFTGLMVFFYFIVGVYAQRRTAALEHGPVRGGS